MVDLSTSVRPAVLDRRYVRQLDGFLLFLIVLSGIAGFSSVYLRLNALAILAGFIYLMFYFKLSRDFLLVYALIILLLVDSFALGLFSGTREGSLSLDFPGEVQFRLLQVFFMVLVAHFLSEIDPKFLPQMIAIVLVPLAVLEFIVEMTVLTTDSARLIFGVRVPRLDGLRIDANFNAMFYGVLGIILLYGGHRRSAFIILFLSMFSVSRGTMLALLAAGAFYVFASRRILPLLYWPLVLGIAALPAILIVFDSMIGEELRDLMILLSTGRYAHWLNFIQMGLENPITGVGYFQGKAAYSQYVYVDYRKFQQAHSLFIGAFGEFGVLGYLIFMFFYLYLAYLTYKYDRSMIPLFVYLIVGFSFLNGLSQWMLWVGIGFLLSKLNQVRYGWPPPAETRRVEALS